MISANDLSKLSLTIRRLRHMPDEEKIRATIASRPAEEATFLIRVGVLGMRFDNPGNEWLPEAPSQYESILQRDLMLASRCLGDCPAVEPGFAAEIAGRILSALYDRKSPLTAECSWGSIAESTVGLWRHPASAAILRDPLLRFAERENAEEETDEERNSLNLFTVYTAACWALRPAAVADSSICDCLMDRIRLWSKETSWYTLSGAAEALTEAAVKIPSVRTSLLALLDSSDLNIQESAATALREAAVSDSAVRDALLRRLDNPGETLFLLQTIQALAGQAVHSAEIRESLLKVMETGLSPADAFAAQALEESALSDERVYAALIEMARSGSAKVPILAIGSLPKKAISEPDVRSFLIEFLDNEDEFVRFAAAQALGKIAGSDPIARDALLDHIASAETIDDCTSLMGSLREAAPFDPVIRETLLEFFTDDRAEVRETAAVALIEAAASDTHVRDAFLRLLRETAADPDLSTVRALAPLTASDTEVHTAMLSLIAGDDPQIRYIAANALATVENSALQEAVTV